MPAQRISRQKGQYRHVSANTATISRVGRSPSRASAPAVRTVPLFSGLWHKILMALGRCTLMAVERSKKGHFTFTATENAVVASFEKILHVPYNNIYDVEGVVFVLQLGTIIAETKGDITVIWKVIGLHEPSIVTLKRVGIVRQ